MTESDGDPPQILGDTMKKRSREEEEEEEVKSGMTMKMQRSETMDSVNDRMSKAAIARDVSESSMEIGKEYPKDERNENSSFHHKMGRIKMLKLEAIFYPKFDNEIRDSDNQLVMREDMLSKVKDGKGYLETTLKHSGSLILWSGYDRYYSKNSMDNLFTTVGEILLRQHFSRSWGTSSSSSCHQNEQMKSIQHSEESEMKYFECSDYVATNQLTLSFEVVTSSLGHHGAIPKRDYLILTAVANRKTATFMSTSDLITFAHKFRLPHNDIWVYSSTKSSHDLFHLYDSLRENGLAETVIPALTKSADGGHVQSLYPHLEFQGNILEGIVIRYVPYNFSDNHSNHDELQQMKHLASISSQLLQLIPAKKPFLSDSSPNNCTTVLNTNLRILSQKFATNEETFQKEMERIFMSTDTLKRRRVITKAKTIAKNKAYKLSLTTDIIHNNFSSFIRDRMDETNSESNDEHTKQILTIIHDLDHLGDAIDYKIFHENTGCTERWLCIIHIHRDETFGKYCKKKSASKLPLFRGFCIELVCSNNCNSDNTKNDLSKENLPQALGKATCSNIALDQYNGENDTGSLLLKMKFLPYMIRTFIIRNGLKILAQATVPGIFERWAEQKLKKWNISTDSSIKIMHLIESWVEYAKPLLHSTRTNIENMKNLTTTLHLDIQQTPLDGKNYLFHYEHFQKLYNQGKFSQTENKESDETNHFRGCLFIIGICDDEDKQNSVMDILANHLGIKKKISDIFSISEMDVMRSLSSERNDSFVCYMSITKKMFNIRGLIKKCGHAMFLVFHGLSKEEVMTSVTCENTRKKIIGISSKLAKLECASIHSLQVVDTPLVNDSIASDTSKKDKFQNLLESIMEASNSLARPDNRRGIIFFFPSIPGSGKSTLCGGIDSGVLKKHSMEKELTKGSQIYRDRKVLTMVGDNVKGKYWPLVETTKLKDPSSILIADKNTPPVSWHSVAKACSNTNGICIPVIPSFPALSTTTVALPNVEGDYNVQSTHTYPFSLFFLATCIERVLSRPPSSHAGKLDSGCENACLVVVKFYSFYRHITADNFKSKLYEQIEQAGVCLTRKESIDVPFFRNDIDTSKLPNELETALNDAINYHYSVDKKLIKATKEKECLLENQLRSLVLKYQEVLIAATDDIEVSKQVFISSICNELSFLDENNVSSNEKTESKSASKSPRKFIKIVSVDVSFDKLQEIIANLTKEYESMKEFIQEIQTKLGSDDESGKNCKNVQDDNVSHNRYIQNTHITLVHHSRMSQDDMRNLYADADGKTVEVLLDAFLFNSEIAAFSVSLKGGSTGTTNKPIQSQNSFPHITIFCGKGISAKNANDLPSKIQANKAQKITFPKPISITGKISFWKQ